MNLDSIVYIAELNTDNSISKIIEMSDNLKSYRKSRLVQAKHSGARLLIVKHIWFDNVFLQLVQNVLMLFDFI